MEGGARPADGDRTQDAGIREARWIAAPASARSAEVTTGRVPPGFVDAPTWQVEQWVLDLTWQTTSWWANGIAASATQYAATTHRIVTASRGRVGATPDYTAAPGSTVYRSRILDS